MRENGYYWVRVYDGGEGTWTIAEFTPASSLLKSRWHTTGSDNSFKDSDFEEIDETPILRISRLWKELMAYGAYINKEELLVMTKETLENIFLNDKDLYDRYGIYLKENIAPQK